MKTAFTTLAWMLACAAATVGASNPALALEAPDGKPQPLWFEVSRKGETIGSHCVRFDRQGPELNVEAAMELEVPLPLWFDYRYRYRASERWRDGHLQRLDVVVEDGDDARRIKAQRSGGQLTVETGSGRWQLPGDLLTSNHWNAAALDKPELLNTLTGKASRIDSRMVGVDQLALGGHSVEVRRYRLGGDLKDTEVWYDRDGQWRGLEFSARDGSRIRLTPFGASPEQLSQAPWNRNPLCGDGRRSG